MKIERTRNSIRSTMSGLLNRGINLLIPFVIRTVMIHKLGVEYLGLSTLFVSLIQVLNLSELGIGSALVFHMYKPVSEDDFDALSGILWLYRRVYRVIGSVILGIGICLMPILPWLVDVKQLTGTNVNLYALFMIYLVNTVISYWFFAYRKSLLMAYQRHDLISNINSMVNIGLYVLQILALLVCPSYYLYILLMPIFTLADNILVALTTGKLYPQIIQRKHTPPTQVHGLLGNVKYMVGHKVGGVVIQSADSIVISAFLNLTVLTAYSNYYYVVSALVGLIHVGYNAILAGVGNSILIQSREKNYELFEELSFLVFYVVAFCSACLMALYQPFMKLWMGEELMLPNRTVVLFVVYFYTWQFRIIGLNFKDAAGMWKNDALKPYVGLVLNMTLNIVLVQLIGVDGVLLATIFVMTMVYFPWETWVLHKDLFKKSTGKYYRRCLFYAIAAGLTTWITYSVVSWISGNSLVFFIMKVIVTVFVSNGILLMLTFHIPQRNGLLGRIKAICNKK